MTRLGIYNVLVLLALFLFAPLATAVDLDPINPTYQDCSNIYAEEIMLRQSKSKEVGRCMKSPPNIQHAPNCSGADELMAWPECTHFSCEAEEIGNTYQQKYHQCMDRLKISDDKKRNQVENNKKNAALLQKFNKVRDSIEMINNPRKFLKKALLKNNDDYKKIFPTDNDKDANQDLANGVYKFAFDNAKSGLKHSTNNGVISAIQQRSLEQIDKHFQNTFKQFDKAFRSDKPSREETSGTASGSSAIDPEKIGSYCYSKTHGNPPSAFRDCIKNNGIKINQNLYKN